jgi:hypothetical protein
MPQPPADLPAAGPAVTALRVSVRVAPLDVLGS